MLFITGMFRCSSDGSHVTFLTTAIDTVIYIAITHDDVGIAFHIT